MTLTNDTPHTRPAVQRSLSDHAPDRPPAPSERRTERERPQGEPTERVIVAPELLEEVELPGRLDLVWRRSPVYGDRYLVSHEGHVLSLPREDERGQKRRARLRKAPPQSRGYRNLHLSRDGETQSQTVHRLVCEAFHGPAPGPVGRGADDYCVDHLDDDKLNNRASNLQWTTNALNISRAKRGSLHHNAVLTEKKVAEMRHLHVEDGAKPLSLAEEYGVSPSVVYGILAGRTWSHVE